MTRTTSRRTNPLASLASSTCSQTAALKPAWTSLARYESRAGWGNPAIGMAFGPLSRLVTASPSRGTQQIPASSPNIS